MTERLDIAHLASWIGREEITEDQLSCDLARKFHVALDLPGPSPMPGDVAPRLIHFCLCQPEARTASLDEDGHPRRGGFLPPIPLPRRMWAGGALRFHRELRVGDTVRRRSRIADVKVKEGHSGMLCFVTLDHTLCVGTQPAIEERQDLIYRAMGKNAPAHGSQFEAAPSDAAIERVIAGPILLFRYSAITFNSHRIHYDRAYAAEVEHYPGLVVHGPLQATLLLHFASRRNGNVPPVQFVFRSDLPLFDDDVIVLHAEERAGDMMRLWTTREGGPVAMSAEARW